MNTTPKQPVTDEETVVKTFPAKANVNTEKKDTKIIKDTAPAWKNVMIGGVPGILLGVGGVFAAQAFTLNHNDNPSETDQNQSEGVDQTGVEEGEIPIAHTPNDDMSFREAFDAARAEVGPGGAFSWHGNVYSTYQADDPEWIEMGPDGQAAHCHNIVAQVHAEPFVEGEQVPEDVPDEIGGVPDGNLDETEEDVDAPVVDEPEGGSDSGEVDVHIIGVENDPESDASAAYGYVDGQAAIFIDQDGDGEVDVVIVDENGDGQLGEEEVFDAEGSGITIEDLANEMDQGQDVNLIEDQPDYSNDVSSDYNNEADIDGF